MLREDWEFSYPAEVLAEAATKKHQKHEDSFKRWEDRKKEILKDIKEDGIDVRESEALRSHSTRKSWDYDEDSSRIVVRNDLDISLKECTKRLSYHIGKIKAYDSWRQVLSSQKEVWVAVDHEDWMFFFGTE